MYYMYLKIILIKIQKDEKKTKISNSITYCALSLLTILEKYNHRQYTMNYRHAT